jgi:protein TonB
VLEEKPVREERPPPEEKPVVKEKPVARDEPVVAETPVPEEQPRHVGEAKPVLKQAKSDKKIAASGSQKSDVGHEPRHLSADQLSQQIADVTTEFNKSRETQAKQQRMVYINSVNAHKYNAAAYEHDWQEKVERIGNLNYPDEARRQNLTGSLLLDVGVNANGSIYSIKVRQSSGEPVLDEAAERIVRLAAPFAAFPQGLREEADILVITRTWRFSVGNRVDTGG